MRRRIVRIVLVLIAAATLLAVLAEPAAAQRIWPLVGCHSYLNWPCPGPAL